MQELREVAQAISARMRAAGVRVAEREGPMGVEYRMLIPTTPRKLLIVARVATPSDEVGKVFGKGGKFRATAKKVAKKLAKSKVLQKVAKIAKVMPGPVGQTLRMASAAAGAAKLIAKAAKKGNPKAKAFAAKAAKKLASNVRKSPQVIKPAPGYPNPIAARQPSPQPGNGFGDSSTPDELDQAQALESSYEEPSSDDSVEPVEVDASDELASDEEMSSEDDSSEDDFAE